MIHIVFNIDEKYKELMKVTAKSILQNTKEDVTFHVIGVKDIDIEGNFKFYPNPDVSCFNKENLKDYYYFSKAAMYRLLIPKLIKTNRAIYLDCDTIVRHDIKELWDMEVDLIGGCKDPQHNFRKKHTKTKGEYYINSGVLLFNLKNIRKQMPDYIEQLIKVQNSGYNLELLDQDIINHLFDKKITYLPQKWNVCANLCDDKYYTEQDYKERDEARLDPAIIHYMGTHKPDKYDDMPFADEFDKVIGRKRILPKVIRKGNFVIIRR
jgi:lipopolysaccharide biosynthesis glycosyltransferase